MRLVLCLLLTLAAAPAWAGWVKVSVTDEHTTYIDPATIEKDGNLRRFWQVYDLKQRGAALGEMSRRYLSEYDCKEERFRRLSMSFHSDQMAGGRVLNSGNEPGKWNDIKPRVPPSPAQTIMRFVCAK